MVTALGLDWETSCAARRAGVLRAEPIEYFKVQANDPWEIQSVDGHRASLVTRGFEGFGRFRRLLAGALSDLVRQGIAPQNDCRLYLSMSNIASDLGAEDGDASLQDPGTHSWQTQRKLEREISVSAKLAQWPGRIRLAGLVLTPHAGFGRLLDQFESEYSPEPAIIAVVDSLLEESQLLALDDSGRLKTSANPVGLMPGEAAVTFLVGAIGKQRAMIGPTRFAKAETATEAVNPGSGVRLAQLIQNLAAEAEWPGGSLPWIISDHNGESVRSQVWGSAFHRLCAGEPRFHLTTSWYPAQSFGDTGQANSAIAAVLAFAAWHRGYAPTDECCIVSSSQDCERSALIMRRLV